MKKGSAFGKGIVTGAGIWLLMIAADAIDEFMIDVDSFLGFYVSFVVLLLLFVTYVVYYIKKKPACKTLLSWFAGYLLAGMVMGVLICHAVNERTFFIEQTTERCNFLCFNGLEYDFYLIVTVGVFCVLCILFHVICAIVNRIKKRNSLR